MRPVEALELLKNRAGFFRIVAGVVAEKHVEVDERPLRPGMQGEVRLGNNNHAGYPAFSGTTRRKLMEPRGDDGETGPPDDGQRFCAHPKFVREVNGITSASREIGEDVQ